ncbi:MAG: FliH/SctL family protein [Aquificota bacterium]|nr:FliH/SctL family protein [Aquificota bacterium]
MYKRFRPIFGTKDETTFQDRTREILEERNRLEERIRELEREVETLTNRNKALEEDLRRLEEEIRRKEEDLKVLREKLSSAKTSSELAESIARSIEDVLDRVKEDLKEEFLSLSRLVIKEFLMTDLIPKEGVVTRILEEVFGRITDIRGRVTVHLSPKDVDRVLDLTADLKAKIGDRVEIEVSSDPGLAEGEVRIETPKFIIERRHGEILEEVFREVIKHVLERGEDLREGGQGKRDIP